MKNIKEEIVATNKKARHNFAILDSFEVGIALKGTEVKSLRQHNANLEDSFARINNGELFLCNMHISPYEYGSYTNVDPKRKRKLLAHKNEITKLIGQSLQKGATLIPLKAYFKHGIAKIELAVARGKRLYDKREAIKLREVRRDVARQFRGKTSL
ncbi:MAG: SsrA-binding protein SmpB [Candidatus Omnitrophica bacterium]|nr:SsrA-binding protein SmpB [Candidatus Omnitrophota bacterium]